MFRTSASACSASRTCRGHSAGLGFARIRTRNMQSLTHRPLTRLVTAPDVRASRGLLLTILLSRFDKPGRMQDDTRPKNNAEEKGTRRVHCRMAIDDCWCYRRLAYGRIWHDSSRHIFRRNGFLDRRNVDKRNVQHLVTQHGRDHQRGTVRLVPVGFHSHGPRRRCVAPDRLPALELELVLRGRTH